MLATDFFSNGSSALSEREKKNVFSALRQDELVWNALNDAGLLTTYAGYARGDLEKWAPGRLALVALDQRLLKSAVKTEIDLENPLVQRAMDMYEETRQNMHIPGSLADSGLLALAIKARRYQAKRWEEIPSELFPENATNAFVISVWKTPLACVFGLIPDKEKYIRVLFNELKGNSKFEVISHILFSNPMEREELLRILSGLLIQISRAEQLGWLQIINQMGRYDLALNLAQHLLASVSDINIDFSEPALEDENLLQYFSEALETQRLAALYQIAGDKAKANDLLQSASRIFAYWLAGLLGQGLSIDETSRKEKIINLDHWLKDPENIKKGLLSLAGNERLENVAEAYAQDASDNPDIAIQCAEALFKQGDEEKAIELARKATRDLIAKYSLTNRWDARLLLGSNHSLNELIHFLSSIGLLQEALQVCLNVLRHRPVDTSLLETASDLLNNLGDTIQAVNFARTAAILDPTNAEIFRKIASLEKKNMCWEKGIESWKRVFELDPNPTVEDWLGYAHCAERTGQSALAEGVCNKLLVQDGGCVQARLILGRVLFQQGRYEEAAEHLSQVVEALPGESDAWIRLAQVQQLCGEKKQAENTLRNGVTAVPNSSDLHYSLAANLLEREQVDDALPFLKNAVRLDPESQPALLELSGVLRSLGKLSEAREVIEQGRVRWPLDAAVAYEHASVLLTLGEGEAALEPLTIAVHSSSVQPQWLNLYVNVLLEGVSPLLQSSKREKLVQAREALEMAISMQPDNLDTSIHLAEIMAALGDDEQALNLFKDIGEKASRPDHIGRIQTGIGWISLQQGKTDIAIAAFREALEKKPDLPYLHQWMAQALHSGGFDDEAKLEAEKAKASNPKDSAVLQWFGKFAAELGDYSSAVGAMKLAVDISPQNVEYWLEMADYEINQGTPDLANETLQTLINRGLKEPTDLRLTARAFIRISNYEQALVCLAKGLENQDRPSAEYLFELAGVHVNLRQYDKALENLHHAIEDCPENPLLHTLETDLLVLLGNYMAASGAIESAIENQYSLIDTCAKWAPSLFAVFPKPWLDSLDEKGLLKRYGLICKRLGEMEEALNHIEKARILAPGDIPITLLHLQLLQDTLQSDRFPFFEASPESIVNGQLRGDVLNFMAETALRSGEEIQACRLINDAVTLIPGDIRTNCLQARLLVRKGDWNEAKNIFINALSHFEKMEVFIPEEDPMCEWINSSFDRKSETLFALIELAVELHGWDEAANLVKRAIESYPMNGRAWLMQASLLVRIAEMQRIYRETRCIAHAPGHNLTGTENVIRFESAIQKAIELTGSPEAEKWQIYGRLVLTPSPALVQAFRELESGREEGGRLLAACQQLGLDIDLEKDLSGYPVTADLLAQMAMLLSASSPVQAQEKAAEAVAMSPYDPLKQIILARVLEHNGQLLAALEAIETALQLWPNEVNWHLWAAELAEGDLKEIQLYHLEQAHALAPENVSTILLLGEKYIEAGNPEGALTVLDELCRRVPLEADTWYLLARAYMLKGDLENALNSAERACSLEKKSNRSVLLCVEINDLLKRYEDAQRLAKHAIALSPDDPDPVLYLSRSLQHEKKAKEALKVLEQARHTIKGRPEIQIEYAKLVWQERSALEALELVRDIVNENPELADGFALLSELCMAMGQESDAENAALTSLRLQPMQPDLNLLLGRIQRKNGQLDRATHFFSETIRQAPNLIEGYLELGSVYEDKRDFQKAKQIYEQGSQVIPGDYRLYLRAAHLLRDSKDYSGAEHMLRRAAELAPDDVSIRKQLSGVIALNLVHHRYQRQ